MATVYAGTDTYGRVKTVCGTPVVTQFAMLQFLPIYPLQSFYVTGSGVTESTNVPFVASIQLAEIHGIPLANLDRLSVFIAYMRSVFAVAVVVGFMGVLVPGVMYLTGEHLDGFALNLLRCMLAALISGIVGGTATYLIPLTTRRERDIRSYCHELLGIAIDPARLPADTATRVLQFADQDQDTVDQRRLGLIRDLIGIRVKLAADTSDRTSESTTDDILFQLRR